MDFDGVDAINAKSPHTLERMAGSVVLADAGRHGRNGDQRALFSARSQIFLAIESDPCPGQIDRARLAVEPIDAHISGEAGLIELFDKGREVRIDLANVFQREGEAIHFFDSVTVERDPPSFDSTLGLSSPEAFRPAGFTATPMPMRFCACRRSVTVVGTRSSISWPVGSIVKVRLVAGSVNCGRAGLPPLGAAMPPAPAAVAIC